MENKKYIESGIETYRKEKKRMTTRQVKRAEEPKAQNAFLTVMKKRILVKSSHHT